MEIVVLILGGIVVVAIVVAVILASQRSAAAGFAGDAKIRAQWQRMRPAIARELEVPAYRTLDDGGKRLNGFGGPVGRIVALQRPMRLRAWTTNLPDADLHAVSDLIDAHYRVLSRGAELEPKLRAVVASRVRTPEERRIMTRAFRRSVLGWDRAAITRLLVDPKVSVKRRLAAEQAVAAGIALVDEDSILGSVTERYVAALQGAEAAYLKARRLLRE